MTGVQTQLLQATAPAICRAAEVICSGGLVAFPTETVYGLGADGLDPTAVAGIFAAKGRPADNPLILHVCSLQQAEQLAVFTPVARQAVQAFWPGPLTVVLPRRACVPDIVTAGLNTVALRWPDEPTAQALIAAAGRPIAAPSANISGRPSPTTAQHVYGDFCGKIPLILDGGPCRNGLESTVLDCTGEIPLLLRPGSVTPELLAPVIGPVRLSQAVLHALQPGQAAPSPGMKHAHYQPSAQVLLFDGPNAQASCWHQAVSRVAGGQRCGVLYAGPAENWLQQAGAAPTVTQAAGGPQTADGVVLLPMDTQQVPYAGVFAGLRKADDYQLDALLVVLPPATGVGLAARNRLLRAGGFIIQPNLVD